MNKPKRMSKYPHPIRALRDSLPGLLPRTKYGPVPVSLVGLELWNSRSLSHSGDNCSKNSRSWSHLWDLWTITVTLLSPRPKFGPVPVSIAGLIKIHSQSWSRQLNFRYRSPIPDLIRGTKWGNLPVTARLKNHGPQNPAPNDITTCTANTLCLDQLYSYTDKMSTSCCTLVL